MDMVATESDRFRAADVIKNWLRNRKSEILGGKIMPFQLKNVVPWGRNAKSLQRNQNLSNCRFRCQSYQSDHGCHQIF